MFGYFRILEIKKSHILKSDHKWFHRSISENIKYEKKASNHCKNELSAITSWIFEHICQDLQNKSIFDFYIFTHWNVEGHIIASILSD